MKLLITLIVLLASTVVCSGADAWLELRKKAVGRFRPLVYNTDGCDMLYWPSNLPVTIENFTGQRLKYTLHTHISTVSYCPQSAGFGHFTCLHAGEPLTGSVPHPNGGCYNSAASFFKLGTDSLRMATEFCQTNRLEVFVSIRVNDQHDSSSVPGMMSALYPSFKIAHPECLMGSLGGGPRQEELYEGYAGWSCVDFAHKRVRDQMKTFVRELVTNYDVDGVEYDFNRHFMLFRSVATGGVASREEVNELTQLMRDLKGITEEVGRRKNRPIIIAMRAPDSVEYDLAVGADIETWFREALVDIWIGGGYFLLNPLQKSVSLAHRYGIKFYWSLDESRIPDSAARGGLPLLPGRGTIPFYVGRYSAARMAGCDGVYLFNAENEFLRQVASIDPLHVEREAKAYFVTDRGSGGYTPDHWLKNGARFARLPVIDPGCPLRVKPGEKVSFEMYLGDDFGLTNRPSVKVAALSDVESDSLSFLVNGFAYSARRDANGVFSVQVPAERLKAGDNGFVVSFPVTGQELLTFNDFGLYVNYSR